jgi:MerR HTH family regulatory protein
MGDRIALGTAARRLGVSRAAVFGMVERGELARKRGPLGWEYSRAEVDRLAATRAALAEQYGQDPRNWPRSRRTREAASA